MGPHMVKYSANYCAQQYDASSLGKRTRILVGDLEVAGEYI